MEWAIIFGDYINALSIVNSLRNIFWNGKIVCVTPESKFKVLVDHCENVEVWRVNYSSFENVYRIISSKVNKDDKKFLFFTSEQYHESLDLISEILPNSIFWAGDLTKIDIILDRFLFYSFIKTRSDAKIPLTIESNFYPFNYFKPPFYLRIRKSWSGSKRRKGVIKINNQENLAHVESGLINEGLTPDDWCYQEILSIDPKSNLSVCGWHQKDIKRYFTTQKVLQHPGNTGNGDVVTIINSSPELLSITEQILNSLNYSGPFELEYVYDEKDKSYKVIELNPRFWMQHALIEANTEFELIRRYLQLEIKENRNYPIKTKFWINSFYATFRIIRLDLRIIKYLLKKNKYLTPSLSLLKLWIPSYIKNQANIKFLNSD